MAKSTEEERINALLVRLDEKAREVQGLLGDVTRETKELRKAAAEYRVAADDHLAVLIQHAMEPEIGRIGEMLRIAREGLVNHFNKQMDELEGKYLDHMNKILAGWDEELGGSVTTFVRLLRSNVQVSTQRISTKGDDL